MNLILKNPYRTVGLLVGATAREQERQVRRLKQYIEAEQDPQDDFSFPTLGHLQRTLNSVEEAASKLNLDSDKINAALFWFWNGNPIKDKAAFEALKRGETETAIEIWKKLVFNSEEEYNQVSKRNASAFHNLSTLYLTEYGIDEDTLQLKLRFLESDFVNEFTSMATDETFKTTKKDLQLLFLKGISQIEDFDTSEFLEAISDVEFIAKSDFLKSFVQKPIEQLEKKIETAKNKRKVSKSNADKVGQELFTTTASDLAQLKSIVGTNDITYTSVADKVVNEILQCGIDYFEHYRDSNTDPSSGSMDLFRKAKSLAVGNIAKQLLQENTENLQEWIDEKPKRDKLKKVEEDLKFITSKLERFQNLPDTVSNAKDLVDSCKPKLVNIRSVLGSTDDFYMTISSSVANNALGMLVTSVNKAQESIEVKIGDFSTLRSVVRSALSVSESIGSMDLISQQRIHYSKNHSALKSIASQLEVEKIPNPPRIIRRHTIGSKNEFSEADKIALIIGLVAGIIGFMMGAGWSSLIIGFITAGFVAWIGDFFK